MSKKLMTLGLMLTFVWSLGARNSNVISPNRGPAKDVSQILPIGESFAPESDIQIVSGYTYRKSYNMGSSRGTADTLAYDLDWGSYFYMTPGDVMVTAFQMPADGILKGVNVRVYRWGTGDQLTVSLHKLSYPYNADGEIYDQDAVNADGWLGGYDPDGSGGLSIEGDTYTAPGFAGECGKGTVIDGARDPLGTVAGTGPPGTPAMGLIWPDGFTAATLDPTNNPGIDNGGGDNWIALADFGSEPELLQGDWVGVVVHYSGEGPGDDNGIGFEYAKADPTGSPWKSLKFYSGLCGGTGGESGWYIRGFAFNYQVAVELTGDRGPIVQDIVSLPTTLSTEPRDVWVELTDDNPSGDPAGVSDVTLFYQYDSTTGPWTSQTLSLSEGTDLDGKWTGQLPAANPGQFMYWYIVATDNNGNATETAVYSYYIFSPTPGNDLIFNNQDALYGTILYSSYLYFYWGGDPFDIWDASYGGITDELVVNYNTIIEEAGTGPYYKTDDVISAWWGGDKTYIVSGDEWLGVRYGWDSDVDVPAGDVAHDILGIAHYYPDVNYSKEGDQDGISRFKPVAGDAVTGGLATFLSDESISLNYDPNYETGGSNWLDGVDPVDSYTVAMTAFAGVVDSASAADPTTDEYNVMIYGQAGNGGLSAFLAFDAMALNTAPDYHWVGASWFKVNVSSTRDTVMPEDASPLISAYEYLNGIVSIDEEVQVPKKFALKGNYPNPFNPSTNIAFTMDYTSNVTLKVYSLLGEEVATINGGLLNPGRHEITWNGVDNLGNAVSSGVYLYRIEAGNKTLAGKMMLLK